VEESARARREGARAMKRPLYLGGLILSAVGLALALTVFVSAVGGNDPSEHAPWLWRVTPFALVLFGAMYLAPGMYNMAEEAKVARALAEGREVSTAPPPHDRLARRIAVGVTALLLTVALTNFWLVVRARTGIPTPTAEQRAAAYRVSRQYTLRATSGFWLVLFGVPTVGFWVLLRESGARPS
jgi:hypothetical protein